MKLSEVIKSLEIQLKMVGDVDLYDEEDDGRATFPWPVNKVQVNYRKIWPTRPGEKHYFLDVNR